MYFFCTSLKELFISSLIAAISYISLRGLFISSTKAFIIFIKLVWRSFSYYLDVWGCTELAYCNSIAWFWWYQIALIFVDCVLTLAFSYLVVPYFGRPCSPDGSRPIGLQVKLVIRHVSMPLEMQIELVPDRCRLSLSWAAVGLQEYRGSWAWEMEFQVGRVEIATAKFSQRHWQAGNWE